MPIGIVAVGVHQADGLPGAQGQFSPDYGQRGMWGYEGREYMVTTVAGASVLVPPAVIRREEIVEGRQEVIVTACPGLQKRYSHSGVRREDIQQSVPALGDVPQEGGALSGQVVDRLV
ncbi:hypothetical protein ADL21_18095 [Streptomyces albus subsp. albus]|nr:hypothetical protein ADL21_18095 [Streptomyces albus subsp. albus]